VHTPHTSHRIFRIGESGAAVNTAVPRLGCFTKVLTAGLMVEVAAEQPIGLDEPVKSCPMLPAPLFAVIPAPVTFRQLLNHTHGMPDVPQTLLTNSRTGFIDCAELATRIGRFHRLAAPGALYSYGSTGILIAAAVLEAICGRRFTELLHERRSICFAVNTAPDSVCPATGAELRMPVEALLSCCTAHLDSGTHPGVAPFRSACVGEMWQPVNPLPGWAPELGSALGWKYYGDGWYGHNGVDGHMQLVLRVHPQQRAAIVISGDATSVAAVQAHLCRDHLWRARRFSDVRSSTPVPTTQPNWHTQYANGDIRVSLAAIGGRELALTRTDRGIICEPIQFREYAPAVYIAKAPTDPHFSFVQLITDHRDTVRLWNGSKIFAPVAQMQ
jgi:Beta-lactamase